MGQCGPPVLAGPLWLLMGHGANAGLFWLRLSVVDAYVLKSTAEDTLYRAACWTSMSQDHFSVCCTAGPGPSTVCAHPIHRGDQTSIMVPGYLRVSFREEGNVGDRAVIFKA